MPRLLASRQRATAAAQFRTSGTRIQPADLDVGLRVAALVIVLVAVLMSLSRGGAIAARPVRPQDLAATTFRHLGIDLKAHWTNSTGRPIPIVAEGGQPISELF